jgi:N-acetylglucosaminyl-diphospho-decaprenol L-rhamnosyltransferase
VDLSIIVVSYNTRELLRTCLQSIYDTIQELRFEVFVVDNNSADGSADMVAGEYPQARVIRNHENAGFARANNQAISVSRGRHVLLLNSDAVLLPGSARAMLDTIDQQPRVAVVGAQLLNPDGSFQGSYADFPTVTGELLLATKLARFFHSPTYPNYPAEQSQRERVVDWVSGACLMARRAAIEEVGLLDEEYFMYTEETDWCYRMSRAGWQVVYQPRARVVHWVSQSSKRVPERRRSMVYRSKWLFMRKHRGRVAASVFRASLWTASALKLCLWASRSLGPGSTRRDLALQHARSYQLVLSALRQAEA